MVTLSSIVVSAAVAAVVMTLTAFVAWRQGRVAVVDVAWGLGFVAIGAAAVVVAVLTDHGDTRRAVLAAVMLAFWGARLAWHIHRRNPRGEDPRYERVLGGPLADVGMGRAVRKVFAVQGAAMVLVAAPVTVSAVRDVLAWPVVAVGVAAWLVGTLFETVGDAQLAAYRAQPRGERRPVLDTGLWRYTRHPNYFGDACVWWGIWLVGGLASGPWVGLATVVAPLAMTYFLVWATGARLLEESMMQRPAYREYARRTSMFVPLPPRAPKGA
ncbi:DUF1295 domain-containing protein [Nocardioides panacisoli]|uniref:DUF1295 domain-containing protein n=1 Tax=Nocardioides panacisoli TaxID=627624 RepID=UPI001C62B152|nr:DUF1295 domain-containing protein [Nocardioides panacisoli]QYJ03178.1 DUF1295 domain-containing protein [Nocardioides panacisoli]